MWRKPLEECGFHTEPGPGPRARGLRKGQQVPLSPWGLGLDKGVGEKLGAEFAWTQLLTRQQTHGKCKTEQGTYRSKSQGWFFPIK